jgi:hypothetical protein
MLLSELTSFIKANRYKGRREAFLDNSIENYIRWAFLHDYLFVSYDNDKISGVGVAYPIGSSYDGDESVFYIFERIRAENQDNKEICIMDMCATTDKGRSSLVSQFKKRYPNWENQRKWAIQFDKVNEISNKYINLIQAL